MPVYSLEEITAEKLESGPMLDWIEEHIDAMKWVALSGQCKKVRRSAFIIQEEEKQCVGIGAESITGCPPDCYPACLDKKNYIGHGDNRHAEENALDSVGELAQGGIMVHLKFSEKGEPRPSERRYCPKCVPLMALAGITSLALLHDDGWWLYSILDIYSDCIRVSVRLSILDATKNRSLES